MCYQSVRAKRGRPNEIQNNKLSNTKSLSILCIEYTIDIWKSLLIRFADKQGDSLPPATYDAANIECINENHENFARHA